MSHELDEIKAMLAPGATASVNLIDTEREVLRALSTEGMPLYKIIKSTLDYADAMREIIASAPLDTEEGVKLARQLQLKRQASLEFVRWFVEQFDEPAKRVQRKDHSRG